MGCRHLQTFLNLEISTKERQKTHKQHCMNNLRYIAGYLNSLGDSIALGSSGAVLT